MLRPLGATVYLRLMLELANSGWGWDCVGLGPLGGSLPSLISPPSHLPAAASLDAASNPHGPFPPAVNCPCQPLPAAVLNSAEIACRFVHPLSLCPPRHLIRTDRSPSPSAPPPYFPILWPLYAAVDAGWCAVLSCGGGAAKGDGGGGGRD